MQEETSIQITFSPEEAALYKIIEEHCAKMGVAVSEYVKEVIKKDLAWGHFAKRKR